jgi:phage gpG-like protein
VTIEQRGAREAEERMAAIAERLRDLSPVMRVAAADTMTVIDDAFAQSRSPDGTPWEPLAESTVARRRLGSSTPLVDTGRLRASMFARATPTGLAFGTNVEYAAPHQIGNDAGRPPRRAFLPAESVGGRWGLTSTGPGGTHWARVREMVRRYIATGEVA